MKAKVFISFSILFFVSILQIFAQTVTYSLSATYTGCSNSTTTCTSCYKEYTYHGGIIKLTNLRISGNTLTGKVVKCDGTSFSKDGWVNFRGKLCTGTSCGNYNSSRIEYNAGVSYVYFSFNLDDLFSDLGNPSSINFLAVQGAYPEGDYYSYTESIVIYRHVTANTYKIYGYVEDADGNGVSGVYISASNGGGYDYTNSYGYYSIEVEEGWSGTIRPSKSGCSFTPSSKYFSSVYSNKRQDFTADCGSNNYLEVSDDYLSFSSSANSKTVTVTSNVSWTVTDNRSWIHVSPTSGNGNGTLTISVDANSSTSSRSGTVTVSGGGITKTITVTQSGVSSSLTVSPTSLSFSSSSGSKNASVYSNVSWTVTDNRSWIHVSPTSGSGNSTLTISVDANSSTSSRSGTVTVSGGGITKTITVTQSGVSSSLTVSPTSLSFSSSSGSKNASVYSNVSWTVTDNRSWIHVSPTSGSGNSTLTISVDANSSTSSRSGTVTVSGGGITKTINVTQVGRQLTPPDADFTYSPSTIYVGDVVNFYDNSSNNPTSWHWDFGDGTSSNERNPSHIYSTAGTYTVSLTVSNADGTDDVSKTLTVKMKCGEKCSKIRILIPRDNTSFIARSAVFKWEHELGRGITKYKFEMYNENGDKISINGNLENYIYASEADQNSVLTFKINNTTDLQYGKTYRWKLTALDENDNVIACQNSYFTVMPEPEIRGNPPVGNPLGHLNNVVVYSNGKANDDIATQWNEYTKKYKYGYQCVEYVMRYYKQNYKLSIGGGDAKDYFNEYYWSRKGLKYYTNGKSFIPPQEGDILVVTQGTHGHVAIVSKVENGRVYYYQQNMYYNDNFHPTASVDLTYENGKYSLSEPPGLSGKPFAGWVRAEPTLISPGAKNYIKTITERNRLLFKFEKHKHSIGYIIYLSKYNPEKNCYENVTGSDEPLWVYENGTLQDCYIKNHQTLRLESNTKYKWRLLVELNAGGIWSHPLYFQTSNNTPYVDANSFIQISFDPQKSVNTAVSGSILAGAKIYEKVNDDWINFYQTDDNGKAEITINPEILDQDSIMVKAPGYLPVKFLLDNQTLKTGKLNVGLFPDPKRNNQIKNIRIDFTGVDYVTSNPQIQANIYADNITGYEVYFIEGMELIEYNADDHHITLNCYDTGEIYFNFIFYNNTDTVFISKSIIYYPSDMLSDTTYQVNINIPSKFYGVKLYANGNFIKELKSSSYSLLLPKGVNSLSFYKYGYKDTTFMIYNATTVNLNMQPVNYSSDEEKLVDFSNDSIQYWRNITLYNYSHTSANNKIRVKQKYEDYSEYDLVPMSRTFTFEKVGDWSNVKASIVLDQKDNFSFDSVYLMIIKDGEFQKILDKDDQIWSYDSIVQKLMYNNLNFEYGLKSNEKIVLMKRLPPIKLLDNITLSGDTVLQFNKIFKDPDKLPNDMNFTILSYDTVLSVVNDENGIYIRPKCNYNGVANLYVSANHDGLEVVNKIKINVISLQIDSVYVKDVYCEGGTDGEIKIFLKGGKDPYSCLWSNGKTTKDLTNITSGEYKVSITDGFGCKYTRTFIVDFMHPRPNVDLMIDENYICLNSDPATLRGNYDGGEFFGDGVEDNLFNPSKAGVGVHNVGYTYTNEYGCSDTIYKQLEVKPLPVPRFINLPKETCINSEQIPLIVDIPQAEFWGDGVDNSIFSPLKAGVGTHLIYTRVVDSFKCENTVSREITVNPLPEVEFIGLSEKYCANSSNDTLQGIPAGGYFEGNGVVDNVFMPSVAGKGEHSITYLYTSGKGCSNQITHKTYVYDLPEVDIYTSEDSVCQNSEQFTLSGTPSSGKFLGTGIVDQITGIFDPKQAILGINRISYVYKDINGCIDTAKTQIYVVPVPELSVTGKDELCLGDSTVLIASGAEKYDWSTGDYGYSIIITPSQSTEIKVIGINSNLCYDTASIYLTVHQLPDKPAVYLEDNLLYTDYQAMYYQWLYEGEEISGATDDNYLATEEGRYNLEVFNEYMCVNVSDTILYSVSVLSNIGEINDGVIHIYPNPAKNYLIISIDNENYKQPVEIEIYNALGKMVKREIYRINLTDNSYRIDVNELNSGLYLLKIRQGSKLNTYKILIEK